MVFCPKCGTSNPDNAQVCENCGAKLYVTGEGKRYRRSEDECFGTPRGGTIVGLVIGVIILLVGIVWFLQTTGVAQVRELWPIAAIILGILIVIGAVYGTRKET